VEARTESAPPAENPPPAPLAEESPAAPPPQTDNPLPEGPELLDRLRPAMRRNRHGAGLSGSVSYLARAFRTEPRALVAAFEALGLVLPSRPNDKPVVVDIGPLVYWLNRDKTGQVWINTREKRDEVQPPPAGPAPESVPSTPEAVVPPAEMKAGAAVDAPPADAPPVAPAVGLPLAAVRLLLRETKRGGIAEELGRLAEQLGQSTEDLLAALTGAGLKVPEKPREKPVFVEHAGEILWLNRNAKGELWLNAKAEKPRAEKPSAEPPIQDDVPAAKRSRGPRRRR
jgi:hypothetical protein